MEVELIEDRPGEIAKIFAEESLTPEQANALIEEAAELSAELEKLMAWKEVELEARAILMEEVYAF